MPNVRLTTLRAWSLLLKMQMKGKLSKKFLHVLLWIFSVIRLLGFAVLGRRMWCGPVASQSLRAHEVSFCKTYHLLPTAPSPSLGRAEQSDHKSGWGHDAASILGWAEKPWRWLQVSACLGWGTGWEMWSCWAGLCWCGCSHFSSFPPPYVDTCEWIPSQSSLLASSEHTRCQGFILPSHLIVSFSSKACCQPAGIAGLICFCVHTSAFCYCIGVATPSILAFPITESERRKEPQHQDSQKCKVE